MSYFGELLKRERKQLGLSQAEFARASMVTRVTIARLETGYHEIPQKRTLLQLANFLGRPVDDLLEPMIHDMLEPYGEFQISIKRKENRDEMG